MAETTAATKDLRAEAGGAILHGGDLDAARAAFPGAPEPWIDLSTGINPWSYPLPPIPADAWTRLPARGAEAALFRAAAACYGAPSAASVAAASGSQALIQLLPRLRAPGRVAVRTPTYAEHAASWVAAGHAVSGVNEPEDADADVLVLVNPNNPDGRVLPPARLLALAETQAARGGWLVVDEAFADCDPAASVAGFAGMPGLIVLRSFGKFFGLAGLRLGVALAEPALASELRRAIGPWAVSGPGLAVATAALSDDPWIAATRTRLADEAEALDRLLTGVGLTLVGGTDLFRLVSHERAPTLYRALGEAGILVRRFDHRPDWLRLGLPPDDEARQRLRIACNRFDF
ncbi:threonine-phosphate decarboxylase CobD [Azospirillum doebereinerae]|uniref:threonine-phosphate decarboxylase CobD n=1 Tax=Azospirillum doebereinerae TaxID=92933 RepID=UPI001EE58BDD|nr:threonine-phosphate decarboxylase CobD [Azospirillum doebereinerae]MCG5241806.1 threonine-phosphate decarboxylase CobD [Azospirillum doebereinerae]